MNRKQRRAQKGGGSAPATAHGLFTAAAEHHRQGRLAEAEGLYRQVLAVAPHHADALHRLGLLAYQLGELAPALDFFDRALRLDARNCAVHVHRALALAAIGRLAEACAACRAAVSFDPTSVEAHANLGLILMQAGQFDAAEQAARQTIALAPGLADGHNILGGALQALGRTEEAAASHRRAVDLAPDYAEAHTSLGNALTDLDQLEDAVAQHRRALALQPDFAEAHNNLGQALWRMGRVADAEAHYRRAAERDPAFVLAHSNLAGALKSRGDLDGAVATLRRAAGVSPDHPALLTNLAIVLQAQGDLQGAMEAVLHGLSVADTPALRQAFVHCAKALQIDDGAPVLRPLLMRALDEGWGRPEDLVRVTLDVVRKAPALQAVMEQTALASTPDLQREPVDLDVMARLGDDALLLRLLTLTPNIDIELERVLASARRALLQHAEAGLALPAQAVAFCAALARQCFINEYVFGLEPGEAERAQSAVRALDSALTSGTVPADACLLAAACYAPLSSLPAAQRLNSMTWPAAIEHVLRLQIAEPAAEAALRTDIPRLTAIAETSLAVWAQYEESPYPRWIRTSSVSAPETLSAHLSKTYPGAGLSALAAAPEVLIAGCGTGRNALETHRSLAGARTLAIDLSLTSLAYAARKAREAGETNLEFAQADLLDIARLGRNFDVIEASGVLHHLDDPFAGWRALLSVLRPGGVMRLGFYSALARRSLPAIALGDPTPALVRQARQTLAARDDDAARRARQAQDFYSLSGCRDLLFHARERRHDLDELAGFMSDAKLRFIGFVVDEQVMAAYRRRFPDDPGGVDLRTWAAFEQDHPDTFAQMYQFWVQKH